MVESSIQFAARAMSGEVMIGDSAGGWSGACLDSRRISGGELFFALPGERTDGHDFLPQAVSAGAAAVVVHRDAEITRQAATQQAADETPATTAWIRVEDTYSALHDLTRSVRLRVPKRLVAITGSAGKTTTKELLAAMLGRRFRTERSPGNLNNLYGFPLSLLNIRDDCEWMVAEMGMSTPGELRQVSQLGRPDAAVFTNVRPAHLENFRDLRAIADAKSELLAGLAEGGLVVANGNDPEVMHIVEKHRAACGADGVNVILYGMEGGAADLDDARLDGIRLDVTASRPQPLADGRVGYRFFLKCSGESITVELPLHGLYNIENCLAAAACAQALGVSLSDLAAAVADLKPGAMRGDVRRSGGLTVIDDSYNSNPDAACKALSSARQLPAERYVAILGEMLELGTEAPSFHRTVGTHAAELGFAQVIGVGELAREIVTAAAAGGAETLWFVDAGEAEAWALEAACEIGDLILVKGSRGVGLEIVASALCGRDQQSMKGTRNSGVEGNGGHD